MKSAIQNKYFKKYNQKHKPQLNSNDKIYYPIKYYATQNNYKVVYIASSVGARWTSCETLK